MTAAAESSGAGEIALQNAIWSQMHRFPVKAGLVW
jgi:hypothetical protein